MPNCAEGCASRRCRPCGLIQMHRSGTVCPSTWPIATGAMVEQPGGQRTGFALLFISYFMSLGQ